MVTNSYLRFVDVTPEGRKTKIIDVQSLHDYSLGRIRWHGAWRQYVFVPEEDALFNSGCLIDIVTYIKSMMEDRATKPADVRKRAKA